MLEVVGNGDKSVLEPSNNPIPHPVEERFEIVDDAIEHDLILSQFIKHTKRTGQPNHRQDDWIEQGFNVLFVKIEIE